MKIIRAKYTGEEGSVFVIAICVVALFALVLGSYITLVQGQATAVARSQSYNSAIPVAEAGVEEALALLNKNYPNIVSAEAWSNSLTADGWSSISSSNTTTKSNLVASANYYQVIISNSPGGYPIITSAGVVPFIEYPWGAQMVTNSATNSTSTVGLTRTIQVQTTTQPLFGAALAAKGLITFEGGGSVDSFNSANTNLSVNGQYSSTKRDDKAIVATDTNSAPSVTGSGSVDIYGYVNTGAGGTVTGTGTFSIGDLAWVNASTPGIEPSRSNDNFNVTFPDISTPTATFVETPSTGTIGGTNYTMVFQGNNYWGSSNVMYETSISFTGIQKAIVTGGAVSVYIPAGGAFSTANGTFIYVAPGSSLSIYCGASAITLAGGSFVNAVNAANIAIYGLPTCTSITFANGASYVGTIYAPEADFTGTGGTTFTGALVANTFSFTRGATMHYDENLSVAGPSTGFVASSWQEIATPTALLNLAP